MTQINSEQHLSLLILSPLHFESVVWPGAWGFTFVQDFGRTEYPPKRTGICSCYYYRYISLLGLPQESTTNQVAYTKKFYYLTILETRLCKVLAGLLSPEGCEKESVPCLSPNVWWFAGNRWHSLTYGSITWSLPSSSCSILPVCMSVSKFPLL